MSKCNLDDGMIDKLIIKKKSAKKKKTARKSANVYKVCKRLDTELQ